MADKKKLFDSSVLKTREEASRFLRELADKVESGSVSVVQGDQELTIEVPQQVKLDFEFTEKNKGAKGIQQEIEVELKWYEGDKGPVQLK